MDYAVLVLDLAIPDDELAGMDDDGPKTAVAVEPEMEHRQAGECADPDTHPTVEREADRRLDTLLVQEQERQLAQPLALGGRKAREHRNAADDGFPVLVLDRIPCKNSPAAPALQQIRISVVPRLASLRPPPGFVARARLAGSRQMTAIDEERKRWTLDSGDALRS